MPNPAADVAETAERPRSPSEPDVMLSWSGAAVRLCGPADIADLVARFCGLGTAAARHAGPADFTIDDLGHEFVVAAPPGRYAFSSRSELVVSLLAEVCALLRQRSAATVLHGAGFLHGGEAVLLTGDANAGKSTLSARAWLGGAPLLGDDHLVYRHDAGRVAPFPRLPLKIRADDRTAVAAVTERAGPGNVLAGRTEDGPCVCVSREAPGVLGCDGDWPVRALYVVDRGRTTSVRPLPVREAIVLVLPQVQPGAAGLRIAGLVQRLAEPGKLFALTVGDNAQDEALAIMRGTA